MVTLVTLIPRLSLDVCIAPLSDYRIFITFTLSFIAYLQWDFIHSFAPFHSLYYHYTPLHMFHVGCRCNKNAFLQALVCNLNPVGQHPYFCIVYTARSIRGRNIFVHVSLTDWCNKIAFIVACTSSETAFHTSVLRQV